MNTNDLPDTTGWSGAQILSHLSCLRAEGPEAASFLHGQLSQDTENLPPDQARLGAYCSPKGRMLADALLLRPRPDLVLMLVGADVAAAALKRLSMFVLRAKAKLSQADAALTPVGLIGAAAERVLADTPLADHSVSQADEGAWVVRLPRVLGVSRALWLGPLSGAPLGGPPAPQGAWAWLAVMSGVPRIEAATVDQFVPQMVNFEVVGGVNFKKGCYPGQEIVARSQYRGTLKRRLFLLHAPAEVRAGQEVFSLDDPGQPAGMLVNAAAIPGQAGWSALAEIKIQHADGTLRAGAAEGTPLHLGALPYDLPSDDS